MTLQLISETPIFHGMAIAAVEDQPGTHLSQVLKLRMGDMRVGDPHAKVPRMLAITAGPTVTPTTTTIPVIKPKNRKPRRNQPIEATVVEWNPNA